MLFVAVSMDEKKYVPVASPELTPDIENPRPSWIPTCSLDIIGVVRVIVSGPMRRFSAIAGFDNIDMIAVRNIALIKFLIIAFCPFLILKMVQAGNIIPAFPHIVFTRDKRD